MNPKIVQVGLDVHRTFSRVTARDAEGKVAWRGRLEHRDRGKLRADLREWPAGTTVVLESTFGWGWLSDELLAAGLDPHLANSRKVAAWRDARGIAKSNRTDADLLSDASAPPTAWRDAGGRAVAVAAGDLVDPRVRHLRGRGGVDDLVRERASLRTLGSLPLDASRGSPDLSVNRPPAPDEIM